jgi:single-stranded DNA-binding protein
LINKPILVDMPARKTKVARPVIRVGKTEYEVVAEGGLAERFAGLLVGTPVMVAGELVKRKWRTRDGTEHEQIEIVATRMTP